MSDGGFYAMYNSGVVEETGSGNQGWRALEYETVAPDRVWVDGPPQSGDVDTKGEQPQHENMLRALYLPRFPSEDVLFVEPNKLPPPLPAIYAIPAVAANGINFFNIFPNIM